MDIQALVFIATTLLLFGLVSKKLQSSIITPPMAFTAIGVLMGAFALLQPDIESTFVETLVEITLVLVLFTDSTRIDLSLLKKEYGLSLRMLGIGLPLTILLGVITGSLIFDILSFWEIALLSAILAPTDAALGQAVVSSERVPVKIRQTLNVESGLNDGLALPAVLIFLSIAGMAGESSTAAEWVQFVALQLLLAPIVGVIVGYAGGQIVDRAFKSEWMSETFLQISALALALLAFAAAELIEGNGFIAAFVAGLTLGNTKREACHQLYEFAEAEGQLLTLGVFLLFGSGMVLTAFNEFSWQIILYALLSLTIVRMIPVAISLIGAKLQTDTILFLGWFGPRGIASIIYGLMVFEDRIPHAEFVFNVIVITVLLSTIAHGVTAAPLANWYGNRAEAMRHEPDMPELEPTTEMPLRM